MNKIRVIPLGGACEIGANSYYCDWDGKFSFLLDCGLNGDGPSLDSMPDFWKTDSKVDFIIISHAHNDHIGSLPFAHKYFLKENGKIYMTKETADLARIVLKDSGKIISKDINKDKFSDIRKELYGDSNVDNILNSAVICDFDKEYSFQDLKITLFHAGHIKGAAASYIKDENMSLFYTGDFSVKDSLLVKGANAPKDLKPDFMICESTNGNKFSFSKNMEYKVKELAKIINKANKNYGKILAPSFALGRTQEMIYAVKKAKEENLIDKSFPVYISYGLSEKISKLYEENIKVDEDYRVMPKGFPKDKSFIYIATSGFFTKESPAGIFAERIRNEENSFIVFPSSYAYDQNKNEEVNFKCSFHSIDFSAHAEAEDIENFVNLINPGKVIFVHGDFKAAAELSRRLKDKPFYPKTNGEEVILCKDKGNVFVKSSFNLKAFAVTVGTSFFSEKNKDLEAKDIKSAKAKCAELNTLFSIKEFNKENSIAHLICTEKSFAAGKEIASILENFGYLSSLVKVNISTDKRSTTGKFEMNDFISALCRILKRYPDSSIAASGGYKFEMATATLIGAIFNSSVYYKHEEMDIDSPALEMENLPAELDISSFSENNMEKLKNILTLDSSKKEKEYESLPDSLKSMIYKDKNEYFLTNLGTIMYSYAQKKIANISARVYFYENSLNNNLFPEKPKENSELTALSPCLSNFIIEVLNKKYSEFICFEEVYEKKEKQSKNIEIRFLKKTRSRLPNEIFNKMKQYLPKGKESEFKKERNAIFGKVIFELSSGGFAQKLSVYVKEGFQSKLIFDFDLEKNKNF